MARSLVLGAALPALLGVVLCRPGDLTPHHLSDLSEEQRGHIGEIWGVTVDADLPIPLIFPGTKWCGDGDIAANYSDLGVFAETDKCCREHDHCPAWIPGFGTNETIGLHNPSPFTRCACECDQQLSQCLREVGSPVATAVGTMFDNILQVKCYRQDFPIVSCLRYGGLFDRSCQEYELDETSDKIWEFFDSQVFLETEGDLSQW
ncbi:Phospholipase A2 [Amphibalanus amphitrite]|uniref:Phospholipase A2 n=2 Tax=Amphibalanus amphitrite TaxID=1232801 RepID=A0A6A4WHN6_AMPAM|nr:Phospholipase A2 [Amphibalanus amphitrite]